MAQLLQHTMNLFGQTFYDIITVVLLLLVVFWYVRFDLTRLERIRQAIKQMMPKISTAEATGDGLLSRIDELFVYEVHPAIRKPWLVYYRLASDGKRRRSPDLTEIFSFEKVIGLPAARRAAESVPGVLMLIGFTATLLGVAVKLPEVFALGDPSATAMTYEQLAKHFSSAFLSAMVGVLAGVIFQLLDRWHLQRTSAALQDFQDLLTKKMPNGATGAASAEFEDELLMTVFMEQATKQFMDKLNMTVGFEFQQTTEHVRYILENQRKTDQAVSLLLTRLEQEATARQAILDEQNAFLFTMRDQSQKSEADNQVSRETAVALRLAADQMRVAMEAQTVAAEGLVEREQAFRTEMREYFETMDSQSERMLRDMTLQLDEAFSRFNDLTGLAHERLDSLLRGSLDEIGGGLQTILDKLDDQVRDINLYAKSLADEVAALNGTLNGSVKQMGNQMTGSVENTFTAFDEGLSDICDRFSSVLTQFRETIEALPGVLQQIKPAREGK